MQRNRSYCPALKIGHLQKQFVHALSANVNRKGQAGKQNKHSEEQEKLSGGRTPETARDLRRGHGHGLVGRRVVTFNSRQQLCKHSKGKNEEDDDDDDNEVVDDDNDTNEGTREGKCGKLALGGRHEIGTQLFHFASVFVSVCACV